METVRAMLLLVTLAASFLLCRAIISIEGVPNRPLSVNHPPVQEYPVPSYLPYRYRWQYDPPNDTSPAVPFKDLQDDEKSSACTFNGSAYIRDGEKLRWSTDSRCISYECLAGQFYIHHEGCLDPSTQRCVQVTKPYQIDCNVIVCTKTLRDDGLLYYVGNRRFIDCYDSFENTCRRAGEMFQRQFHNGQTKTCFCGNRDSASYIECFDW
ncbi:hypothetical protein PoB_000969200 [Plakobranchus ocellatus]|uniref:DUF4789 domain-containing protein n=1 Tax=Plakobranchus ocellatus TaxID=259542 RepID=A0AAV3YLD0_9GAST|nr:hypothetical protein PoB_000969200 [Plakobranchus ocellatus]